MQWSAILPFLKKIKNKIILKMLIQSSEMLFIHKFALKYVHNFLIKKGDF